MKKQSTAKPSTKSKPKTAPTAPAPILPKPEAGKRLMLDGENCEITSRKWEAEDSPEIVTHNGVELPVTTIKRYIIDFTIRKPDGTAIRLVVHPPFLPLQARMNPLEVESITPVMMAAGLGGRDEIPYNALVHFAEQSAPRQCYVERLPVEGEAPAREALREAADAALVELVELAKSGAMKAPEAPAKPTPPKREPLPSTAVAIVARLWQDARLHGLPHLKSPGRRVTYKDLFSAYSDDLRAKGVEDVRDVERAVNVARKGGSLPAWNRHRKAKKARLAGNSPETPVKH